MAYGSNRDAVSKDYRKDIVNAKYANMKLPDNIKCVNCQKVKAISRYSRQQQNELKKKIAEDRDFGVKVMLWIPCMACNQNQIDEKECSTCEVTKPRSAFSAIQFKMDEPTCTPCHEDQWSYEPGGKDEDYESSSSGGNGSHDGDLGGGTTLAGSVAGMSVRDNRDNSSANGGVTVLNSPTSKASGSHASGSVNGGLNPDTRSPNVASPSAWRAPKPASSDAGSETSSIVVDKGSNRDSGSPTVIKPGPHRDSKSPSSVVDGKTTSTTMNRGINPDTGLPKGFDPKKYRYPKPSSSIADSETSTSRFAKIGAVKNKGYSDDARAELQRAHKQKLAEEDDVGVAASDSDD